MINFDIPKEEAERIFKEMIIPQVIRDISPQDFKQAFILGGQPGSGKSSFAHELLKVNKNIVFINGDDLRRYHPKYYFYLKENDTEAADMTQAVCNFWIESLVEECIQRSLNFIVEGTMRKKDVPFKTAELLQRAGYLVNIVAVSAPYELSLLSLECRYNELKKIGLPARYTKKESHDEAYNNIEGTLRELLSSGLFQKVFIFKREEGALTKAIFEAEEKDTVMQFFIEGRNRSIENTEKEGILVKEYKVGSFEGLK